MDWETNINIYMQVVTKEKSPEELRPDFCVHCQSKQFFHRHDHYTRNVHTPKKTYSIVIHRFLCSSCKHTKSILPSFIGPHQTVIWDVMEDVFKQNKDGIAIEKIAGQIKLATTAYAAKTLWRWKRCWDEFLIDIDAFAWQWLLTRSPHLLLPVGKEKLTTAWQGLFYIWPQAKAKIPALQSFGLFHWLKHLSRSLPMTAGP